MEVVGIDIVTSFVICLPLIAFMVGLKQYRYLNPALKYMLWFVALGTFTEISNFIVKKVWSAENTMPLGNAYFFVAFLLLGLYFMYLFRGYIARWVFVLIVVLYQLYFISNLWFVQSIYEFPAIPKAIGDIILFVLAMVFFHKTMLEAKVKHIWKEPLVYTNLGILLYFAGSLFYSVLFNVVLENALAFTDFTRNYFYVLNVVFYALLAIGFWKAGKQQVKNSL